MIKKLLLIIVIIVFLTMASFLSPPYAADYNMEEELNYDVYESDIWSETHNSVNESESHFIDLGTRTSDGSMHIYIQSQAPSSNYELNINNVELQNGETIFVNATVEQTNDMGATVITDVDSHIDMKEISQTDVDYLKVEITDGWGEKKVLQRDACGCVLKDDPRPN